MCSEQLLHQTAHLSVIWHQNRLKDRSVIQLHSMGVYLALADGGGVVGVTNPDHKNSESALHVY